jgi:hypothetical protein
MKKLLIGLLGLLLVVAIVGVVMPTTYAIEKSVTIQAGPNLVHSYVGDLRQWDSWAPWVEADPTIVTTYGATTTGVGASQTWTSEEGDGELIFTRSDPETGIAYDMAFIMGETRAPADCAMIYDTSAGTTRVTWTMEGDTRDFMPPVIAGLITPLMKGSIGSMFDLGLEKLKTVVETAPQPVTPVSKEPAAEPDSE